MAISSIPVHASVAISRGKQTKTSVMVVYFTSSYPWCVIRVVPDYRNGNYIDHRFWFFIAHSSKVVICLSCGHPTAEPHPSRIKRTGRIGRCVSVNILGGDYDDDVTFSTLGLPSAAKQLFFQVSASLHARSHSCFSFSLLVVSSAMACSVSSFSNVHFSIFCASFSFNC